MRWFSLSYLLETVDVKHGDIPLLVMCFTMGLLDVSSYNWGVFVGMQTGNTVILSLSTASLPSGSHYAAPKSLVSIGSFLLGAYLTLLVSRYVNKHSRVFLFSCFLIQALLLSLAALLSIFPLVPENPQGITSAFGNILVLMDIPPLAFQFGIQMATSRILGFGELPSNMLTSSYTDLVGDSGLFRLKRNSKRERRLASIVLIIGGWNL